MNTPDFSALGLGEVICRVLERIGYHTPTPIQVEAIPALLEGRDLLGLAQTGTGKTGAFALPIIERLHVQGERAVPKQPDALILAPTRELASQIGAAVETYAAGTQLRHTCVFGGVGQNPQVQALRRGVHILIATPGRLLDLCEQGAIDLSAVSHFVLDEADRLLDMGFIRDIRRVVRLLPRERQSMLFSATMPGEVEALAAQILHRPARVATTPKRIAVERIEQSAMTVEAAKKQSVLEALLRRPEVSRAIVFTRTKHGANRVAKKLDRAGIAADAIHGNKSQNARTRALEDFKAGATWVLVATDIAARGIDIEDVSHVVNFELPHEPESYVHRIGRTARAGAGGVAWSLVDPSEKKRLKAIERLTGQRVAELTTDAESDLDEDSGRSDRTTRPDTRADNTTLVDRTTDKRSHSGASGADSTDGKPRRRRRRRRTRRKQAA